MILKRGLWAVAVLVLLGGPRILWGSEVQGGTRHFSMASPDARVEALWNSSGLNARQLSNGSLETDFGGGVRRINWPDGHAQLFGVVYDSQPVTYELEGNNELWHFDLTALTSRLESGLNRCVVALPGRPEIRVFSQHPLSNPQLRNITRVITLSPEKTFASDNTGDTFLVADELGAVRGGTGGFVPLGGLRDSAARTVFIRTNELDSYEASAFILRHEAGHDVDARLGWLSRALLRPDGKPLFGSGTLVLNPDGTVNLEKSSFESVYASSNANEDFAETHEFLLRFREKYDAEHPSRDLFNLTPADFSAELENADISPDLRDKMSAILYHAYVTNN